MSGEDSELKVQPLPPDGGEVAMSPGKAPAAESESAQDAAETPLVLDQEDPGADDVAFIVKNLDTGESFPLHEVEVRVPRALDPTYLATTGESSP